MMPNKIIKVAVDDVEVVAFDHFIDAYREFYEEVGSYEVYELRKEKILKVLEKKDITYYDILNLDISLLKVLTK